MKVREQINLIRAMPSALGKLQAASGDFPSAGHVPLEDLRKILHAALFGVEMAEKHPTFPEKDRIDCERYLLMFGRRCAEWFTQLDARRFREWADFLEAKQQPAQTIDPIRMVLATLALDGGLVNIAAVRAALKVRHRMTADQNVDRRIYRIAKELGVRVYGTIGRPKKVRHKHGKKRSLKP